MDCKICHQTSKPLFDATILLKHRATYYQCSSCGFIQTEEPFWLNEAYANPISTSDAGLVGRNISYSRILRKLITLAFDPSGSFIDYGAGYGLLVRLMRDHGMNYHWNDKFTPNLFAQGFEHQTGTHYDILTAFEVFEHLPNPKEEMAVMTSLADTIIFSTELVPTPPPRLQDWYYYSPTNGQHVSFYTKRSLQLLGLPFDLHYAYLGGSLHIFTKSPRNAVWLRFVAMSRLANVFLIGRRRHSLTQRDSEAALAKREAATLIRR